MTHTYTNELITNHESFEAAFAHAKAHPGTGAYLTNGQICTIGDTLADELVQAGTYLVPLTEGDCCEF